MEKQKFDHKSPEKQPVYSIGEASRYLSIPAATLRSWVAGRKYPTGSGPKFFRPVIQPSDDARAGLSFVNLVEAHVLDAIRRHHQVPLSKIREAIHYLRRQFSSVHPPAEQRFQTDGVDLFVEKFGQLINVTQSGQIALRELLRAHLHRVEHDATGTAVRLYPFTRKRDLDEPKVVVIDPHISYWAASLGWDGDSHGDCSRALQSRRIDRRIGGGLWPLAQRDRRSAPPRL